MKPAGLALEDILSSVEKGSNVLVLAPTMEGSGEAACARLLSIPSPDVTDALLVSFFKTPDDRVTQWKSQVSAKLPPKLGIVDVGGSSRSAAAAPNTPERAIDDVIKIETVSNPGDLTTLGIRISNFLSAWETDDRQIVVCFETLTAFLQYADVQRTFRFLHVRTGRTRAVDAIAHFHMDPTAHDDQTISMIRTLFDTVVEVDNDN